MFNTRLTSFYIGSTSVWYKINQFLYWINQFFDTKLTRFFWSDQPVFWSYIVLILSCFVWTCFYYNKDGYNLKQSESYLPRNMYIVRMWPMAKAHLHMDSSMKRNTAPTRHNQVSRFIFMELFLKKPSFSPFSLLLMLLRCGSLNIPFTCKLLLVTKQQSWSFQETHVVPML